MESGRMGCVVFDIDDTLYLEREYVRSGFACVGKVARQQLGVDGLAERAWELFESGVRGRIFDVALETLGVDPAPGLIGMLVDSYRKHAPAIQLAADARRCLEDLRGHDIAAVTDGPRLSQRAKVAALGLSRWIRRVVYTEELGPGCGKPNPLAFEIIQSGSGNVSCPHVYIADNPAKDFAGPLSLGWQVIRIRRPGSLHQAIPTPPEVATELPDLSQLRECIKVAAS